MAETEVLEVVVAMGLAVVEVVEEGQAAAEEGLEMGDKICLGHLRQKAPLHLRNGLLIDTMEASHYPLLCSKQLD